MVRGTNKNALGRDDLPSVVMENPVPASARGRSVHHPHDLPDDREGGTARSAGPRRLEGGGKVFVPRFEGVRVLIGTFGQARATSTRAFLGAREGGKGPKGPGDRRPLWGSCV